MLISIQNKELERISKEVDEQNKLFTSNMLDIIEGRRKKDSKDAYTCIRRFAILLPRIQSCQSLVLSADNSHSAWVDQVHMSVGQMSMDRVILEEATPCYQCTPGINF